MAVEALPKYVAFKSFSADMYLRFVKEDVQIHGYLKYDGHDVVTSYTKYEVEPAKVGKCYVHIRCCYNNKYWVCPSKNTHYVVAAADEPNEDQSNWACMLFEPIYDSVRGAYQIKHVHLGCNTLSGRDNNSLRHRCLTMATSSQQFSGHDLHIVMNLRSFFALPKYVAFKGGPRNQFLRPIVHRRNDYLRFSAVDKADTVAAYEVSMTWDGNARIKSDSTGRFWRADNRWIRPDSTTNNRASLFWPVRVDTDIVAFRSLDSNNFCIWITADNKIDTLNAAVSNITREARIELHERVLSRSIYDVNYRLFDARIYDENLITMANTTATNATSEVNNIELKFSYTVTQSTTWNSTVSVKLGVTTTIQAGVPLIAEGSVSVSSEFSGTYTWGKTKETISTIESTYILSVPPRTRVRASVLGTQGRCDIPFSYTQRDILMNGTPRISYYDDGLYTNVNCYNFHYKTEEEPL